MPWALEQTEHWRLPSPRPWWTALSAGSVCGPRGSRAIWSMARSGCSNGWWIATSHHTYRCGISRHVLMAPSAGPTSSSINNVTYICPGGAELTSAGNIDQGHIVYYRASKSDCSQCSLKPKCTTATVRKITRDLNEDVRDRVRALADTEAFQQSRRERKKVEMRFAHMKRIFRLDRFRLRGLSGVRDEVLLTATAQNLRRLAKLLCRAPPPSGVACLA